MQRYASALLFTEDESLWHTEASRGWEKRKGPSLTVVDSVPAGSLATHREGVNCFLDRKRPTAGLGLQGSKITRIDR